MSANDRGMGSRHWLRMSITDSVSGDHHEATTDPEHGLPDDLESAAR
jgi:hypothetical protein